MKAILAIFASAAFVLGAATVRAQNGDPINTTSTGPTTLAVFGDWPYSQQLLDEAPQLIASINSDSKVRLVLFLGDIHSGTMPCTGAGLTPPPPVYDPNWNTQIFNLFQQRIL